MTHKCNIMIVCDIRYKKMMNDDRSHLSNDEVLHMFE